MEIILLEKIVNLGNLGDKVTVSPGYGRNYLIPKGKAVRASAEKISEFEQRRAELEKKAADILALAQAQAQTIANLNISISRKAGDEGKLYGSIGAKDISDAVSAAGVALEKSQIRLPNGALRNVGEYEIKIHLHADQDATLNLKVVGE